MEFHVRVVEAKEIANMDSVGKTDPYCTIKIVGTNQKGKTSTKKDTLTPIWNEEFHFAAHNPNKQIFMIKMYDHDVAADDEMATLSIPLATLEPGRVKDQWFEMLPNKKVPKGGKIHLIMHLNYFGLPAFREVPPSTGPGPYVLNLKLIEAKDVPKMDLGKSDPYVVAVVEGQTHKTKVINNTLTPKWDETFTFDLSDYKTAVAELTLIDKDIASDDKISKLEIGCGYLPYGHIIDQWFTLENLKGGKKKGGQIHVQIQLSQKGKKPFQ